MEFKGECDFFEGVRVSTRTHTKNEVISQIRVFIIFQSEFSLVVIMVGLNDLKGLFQSKRFYGSDYLC